MAGFFSFSNKPRSIRTKLLLSFCVTAFFLFVIDLILFQELNYSMKEMDAVYSSNVSMNDFSSCLEAIQEDIYVYLNTKSTDSLENFYRNEQDLRDMIENFNNQNVDNPKKLLEKNIRNMTMHYLNTAEETLQAKRGRNIEKYRELYDQTTECFHYIEAAVYNLNNQHFKTNSNHYKALMHYMNYSETVSLFVIILVAALNIALLIFMIRSITRPLGELADAANKVAGGDFDVSIPEHEEQDEIGIMTTAFSKMVSNIREYIREQRESMEKERRHKEQELLMETHLKDAQLKYLQAQINPHFLFNSLNAGVQLSVMEDAEKTGIFLERMADFFRYNVKKIEESSTLSEELEAVDNYVYILNVRFAGDIHFEKEIMENVEIENVVLPSMILQPLVENAVNHGIRNIDWEGHIWLRIYKENDTLILSVKDNGLGMTPERITDILSGHRSGNRIESDSTGIGLDNVIHRMEIYYEEKDLVEIYSDGPDQGCEVRLRIPMR